ncbi:MAG: tRNA cyclic N6-threonylcarbamoyladenosine(37) synthase TcdA [Proteobacteria bacterium]|nr:tRNA cyclic N6-threonylcarbamoyladenosine(37) synthase TcdA [Pseudomonadota bacterium]
MAAVEDMDFERRFGGIARLYGAAALARLAASHVCVIGIGGVGSWAAEALARSAVGRITLVDLDHVAESNTNRQIHALDGEFGKAKVQAMAQRIRAINPACVVTAIEEFIVAENVAALLPPCDAVLDAIDNVRAKAALIAHCRSAGIVIVTTGAAGGRCDPTRIQVADLAHTVQDALASKLRAHLRKEYGFTRDQKKKFGVECVFSVEPIVRPESDGPACDLDEAPGDNDGLQGLNCAGYGSSVTVTAAFGFAAAARVLDRLISG